MVKILVCGTRMKGYDKIVRNVLNAIDYPFEIIHGACLDCADWYAEMWADENGVKEYPYPAGPGYYLKRNMKMVMACDTVIAFWDGFSYGTAHTIATAIAYGKKVRIIMIK